ncbi:hypothetical protein BJ546DRAFT_1028568 [Cryomyces antarcticus]
MAPSIPNGRVDLLLGQIPESSDVPIPYTSTPAKLFWSDIFLIFRYSKDIFKIASPIWPFNSGELDELYPLSRANVLDILLHSILVMIQLPYILSLPFWIPFLVLFPHTLWALIVVTAIIFGVTKVLCTILNGNKIVLQSQAKIRRSEKHDSEHWIFINGVSVGQHWLQANIDRLSLTFGRPVTGVHNPTGGIIFDLVQCVIQRDYCYATQDIRDAYAEIKKSLMNPRHKKVVLILHSQGGIEGGLIIDWLLAEAPQGALRRLEVYTFGNAANHFNSPSTGVSQPILDQASSVQATNGRLVTSLGAPRRHTPRAIRYIEHYGNSHDFVARWGVLNFARMANRYMGRIFERPGSGHLLNQHYLDYMFPLDPTLRNGYRVALDNNEFMEMDVDISARNDANSATREGPREAMRSSGGQTTDDVRCQVELDTPITPGAKPRAPKVKDFSRLWLYRNGQSPPPEGEGRE